MAAFFMPKKAQICVVVNKLKCFNWVRQYLNFIIMCRMGTFAVNLVYDIVLL